jgi:phage shock protein A
MKQKILSRVGRIISGSVHALVDSLEGASPEVVMEQAVREVDSAIAEVRQELGRTTASKHLANRRLSESNTEHEELSYMAEGALASGREDLVEAAIARQLDIEAQIPVLEESIRESSEQEKELGRYISALQAKRREMDEQLEDFRAEQKAGSTASDAGSASPDCSNAGQKVDEARSAFDRVLSRYTKQRLRDHGTPEYAAQLAELEDLSRKNRIHERLAAMKAGERG